MSEAWRPGEYEALFGLIGSVAQMALLIQPADLERIATVIGTAHALGPVLDPTAYRNGMQNLDDQERLLRAFRVFRGELEAMREDMARRTNDE